MNKIIGLIVFQLVFISACCDSSYANDPIPKCKFFIPDRQKHTKEIVELTRNTELVMPLKVIRVCSPRSGRTLLSGYLRQFRTYFIYSHVQIKEGLCIVTSEKIFQRIYKGRRTWGKASDNKGVPIHTNFYAVPKNGKCPSIASDKYFIASGIPVSMIGKLAHFFEKISSSERAFEEASSSISKEEKKSKSWSKFSALVLSRKVKLVEMQPDSPRQLEPFWFTIFSPTHKGVMIVRIGKGTASIVDFKSL